MMHGPINISVGGFATLLEITTSNGTSLACQILKVVFIQQSWIFSTVYIEYLMSLISESYIERFLWGR